MGIGISSPPARPDGVLLKLNSGNQLTLDLTGSEQWMHISTLNPAASAAFDTGAMSPTYDEYLLIGMLAVSTAADMGIRFGSAGALDTGGNYDFGYTTATTVANATAATAINIGNGNFATEQYEFVVCIKGITRAVASGRAACWIKAGGVNSVAGFRGSWIGGNATVINILGFTASGATMTGRVEVFGRNRIAA